MSTNITMPALSPTMEEGNLAKWLVKEGDTVSAGDVIAEIETDKATMEVEAVDEGVVAKILVAEGTEGVKVNAVIAVLAEEGEDVGDVTADPAPAAAPAAAAPAEAPAAAPAAAPAPAATAATAPASAAPASGERVFATPLARRIASQGGLDISAVTGSGPHGRIVKADVEAALASGVAAAPMAAASTAAAAAATASGSAGVALSTGMSDDMVLRMFAEDSYEKKPHDGMRRVIAERLTESTQSIPSYFVTMDCELDALLALRSQMNAGAPTNDDGKPLYKISVNDFIVKAMALALKAVPMANVSWTSTDRLFHKHADVGVAVAVEDGLFTPIVRQAELKSLSAISAEVKDMASRARDKKLKPEEYQGGCTAVSNLGMFGVKEFTSIINPPHASIVSIGAGEKRPVVKGDELAIATVMAATFAFDHRAIDGALGAELAAAFKGYIENPLSMLV
ncbi:MAG: pyruvate dehydrogenase complex dihydrolipoamide acetyltransferase [Rhizobiaceae bacterium]|nr:pyruvate dehydrogenase complex dihydrolipoamide acetyltransferase [Hyphomicrobiales bacterium]NRB32745.1 pyruvate dehydrogenase complex dihydrolipoamide acetyltransferase [Rhizobiaceae bacterium]